jgi:hypothetical protein
MNTTAKARREVQKELTSAIANKVERGTVVTSVGKWIAFSVKYFTFANGKTSVQITLDGKKYGVCNCFHLTVNDAASAALYEWGFTR